MLNLPGLPLTQIRVVFDVSVENSWKKRNFRKGIPIFLVGKFRAFLNISFRLSSPFFVKRNWLRQMVNAITEWNQNSPVLNSVYHLPQPWSDRLTHVNSRKTLYLKACDTASSHRYLPLGTFRQRAVRGGCIAEYVLYIIVGGSNDRSLQYL